MKGFICYSSGSSAFNLHLFGPSGPPPLFLLENSWEAADSLQTTQNDGPAWDYTTTPRPPPPPPSCPRLLLGHQKACVFIVAITLIGSTLWANIPAIRYTSKHDCKHALWHWVNMLAEWRNVKWDSSKRLSVSAATHKAHTSIQEYL